MYKRQTLSHLISGEAPPNSQARLAALAANQPDLYTPLCGRFPQYDDAYLAAIDKAMNIVPANRTQSAKEWAAMIDPARRAKMAKERAQDDAVITQTITQLVATVNKDLTASPEAPKLKKQRASEVSKPKQGENKRPLEIIPSAAEIQAEIEEWKRKNPDAYAAAMRAKSVRPSNAAATSTLASASDADTVPRKRGGLRRLGRIASIPVVMMCTFLLGQIALAEVNQRALAPSSEPRQSSESETTASSG